MERATTLVLWLILHTRRTTRLELSFLEFWGSALISWRISLTNSILAWRIPTSALGYVFPRHGSRRVGPDHQCDIFYNGSCEEGQERFTRFINLGPVLNALDMTPCSLVNPIHNPRATYGDRRSFKESSISHPWIQSFVELFSRTS